MGRLVNLSYPLPLTNSWPIYEAPLRLPLGHLISSISEPEGPPDIDVLFEKQGVGIWQCDLRQDDRLSWTAPVHALFGIGPDEPLTRSLAVSVYTPDSRRQMEELRAHAIRHKRGFTLDARIRRADGEHRWMRLCAMPMVEGRKVVRLVGTKQDVTAQYDGEG